jgi:hypothetical protein
MSQLCQGSCEPCQTSAIKGKLFRQPDRKRSLSKDLFLTPLVEVSDRLVATGLTSERAGRVIIGLAEGADHVWQELLVNVTTAIWRISMLPM